jgi:hypothetical protein
MALSRAVALPAGAAGEGGEDIARGSGEGGGGAEAPGVAAGGAPG